MASPRTCLVLPRTQARDGGAEWHSVSPGAREERQAQVTPGHCCSSLWPAVRGGGAGQSARTSPSRVEPWRALSRRGRDAFLTAGGEGARRSRRARFREPEATWVPMHSVWLSRGPRPKTSVPRGRGSRRPGRWAALRRSTTGSPPHPLPGSPYGETRPSVPAPWPGGGGRGALSPPP